MDVPYFLSGVSSSVATSSSSATGALFSTIWNSSAPMSQAGPLGRICPSMSMADIGDRFDPASIASAPYFKVQILPPLPQEIKIDLTQSDSSSNGLRRLMQFV